MAAALACAWGVNAAHADTVPAQVTIAGNGQVIVRGARITSLSGGTIGAYTSWGRGTIRWTVLTNGSTKFPPYDDSRTALKDMRIGDTVSFSGELDQESGAMTVHATVVRDSAFLQTGALISGSVVAVDTARKTITVRTEHGAISVAAPAGTIITRGGDPVKLTDIAAGFDIKALGALNTTTHTLSADKITLQEPQASAEAGRGPLFTYILRWLYGGSGRHTADR